ncbi:DEAD/DEAH box helicase [Sarcoptes scabiei]|nr:DEAD/DEAH box helicase [Sarcoptes scabiei]
MPSIWSKLLMTEWNLPYNCYELGHTWTPYCSEAALEMGLIVFQQSLKLYAPLYLGNQILQRKMDRKSFLESFRSIIRSSTFLGINAFAVIYLFCLNRYVFGRFYYTFSAYVPSFLGSLLAILNERTSRRQALAFYVTNIASETLFRVLVTRGHLKPVTNGQFYLFATAVMILISLYENESLNDHFLKNALNILINNRWTVFKSESKSKSKPPLDQTRNLDLLQNNQNFQYNLIDSIRSFLRNHYRRMKAYLPILDLRHRLCLHAARSSCFEHLVFESFLRNFLVGWSTFTGWIVASKLMSGRFRQTVQLFRTDRLLSKSSLSFAMFLSSFTTILNLFRCLLCHLQDDRKPWHSVAGGLIASLAIYWIPESNSITLYLFWKSIESLFNYGVRKKYIKYDRIFIPFLYAMATSQLFNSIVMDPTLIKPSYRRFIDKISQNRLNLINRNLLDVFGTNASKGFETFWPRYDLQYTTKRFQESILVWQL